MNDAFWIGVWPGIGDAERDYMVETWSRWSAGRRQRSPHRRRA